MSGPNEGGRWIASKTFIEFYSAEQTPEGFFEEWDSDQRAECVWNDHLGPEEGRQEEFERIMACLDEPGYYPNGGHEGPFPEKNIHGDASDWIMQHGAKMCLWCLRDLAYSVVNVEGFEPKELDREEIMRAVEVHRRQHGDVIALDAAWEASR